MPQPYLAAWTPGEYLHVYNRACEHNLYFHTDRHRVVFLMKMGYALAVVLDVLAYCLLPNHWHAFVRLPTVAELRLRLHEQRTRPLGARERAYLDGRGSYSAVVAQAFSNFANAYSSHLRVATGRRGRLAAQQVRRVRTRDGAWHRAPAAYVLVNHRKHGLTQPAYPWTSLHAQRRPAWVRHDLLLAHFGGEWELRAYLADYLRRRGQAMQALDEEVFFGLVAPGTRALQTAH